MAVQTLTEIPLLTQGQDDAADRVNKMLYSLTAFLYGIVTDVLATPPSLTDTDDGKAYLVASSATGAWSGWEKRIAIWTGTEWIDVLPVEGMRLFVTSGRKQYVRYNGSSWVPDSDRLFFVATIFSVGAFTAWAFAIDGLPTNSLPVAIPFNAYVKSVSAVSAHQNGSDAGDLTIVVRDFGGGGDDYYNESGFDQNAADNTPEFARVNNSSGDTMAQGDFVEFVASGPSTTNLSMRATFEIERVY